MDTWIALNVEQSSSAPARTETYGSLVDRIVIAWLRASRLEDFNRHVVGPIEVVAEYP